MGHTFYTIQAINSPTSSLSHLLLIVVYGTTRQCSPYTQLYKGDCWYINKQHTIRLFCRYLNRMPRLENDSKKNPPGCNHSVMSIESLLALEQMGLNGGKWSAVYGSCKTYIYSTHCCCCCGILLCIPKRPINTAGPSSSSYPQLQDCFPILSSNKVALLIQHGVVRICKARPKVLPQSLTITITCIKVDGITTPHPLYQEQTLPRRTDIYFNTCARVARVKFIFTPFRKKYHVFRQHICNNISARVITSRTVLPAVKCSQTEEG